MLIIPAVDLKNGRVVRLFQGDQNKEKVYSDDPVDVAKDWESQGAELIHVVDLDGAFTGSPKNLDALEKVVKDVSIPIEFGGGIRTEESISKLLNLGVYRVVLGTVAFEDRALLEDLIKKYKEKVIVSVDVKNDGTVALKGWTETAGKQSSLVSFAKYLSGIGVSEIIFTDIERDGTLLGLRTGWLGQYLVMLAKDAKIDMSLIVAGGVSSLKDIAFLKGLSKTTNLRGAIIGKALYEGRFTLAEAIECKPTEKGEI